MKLSADRVLSAISGSPWLISEEGLQTIYTVASRNGDIEAVKMKLEERHPDTEKATVRGSVGIVPVLGPIFPKANLMTEISGATALSKVAVDFQTMLDDPNISSIILNINSPGGVIDGINEFSNALYAAREKKKVVAYVGSTAASAAYWWAAACEEIVVDATARLGSIGVVAGVRPKNEGDPLEITNTASPNKRYDATTKEGRKILVSELDDLANVFISQVATFRNVSIETVKDDFGKGGMLIGQAAIDAGMADRLGSYEELVLTLQEGQTNEERDDVMDYAALTKESLLANRKDLVEAIQNDAVSEAKAESSKVLSAKESEVAQLKEENETLKAEQAKSDDRLAALERNEAIRAEKDLAIESDGIISSRLEASSLPARLHSKVRATINTEKFVADGKLDAAALTAHVDSEVSDWEASVGETVQGIGLRSPAPAEAKEDQEDDALVSRMLGEKA